MAKYRRIETSHKIHFVTFTVSHFLRVFTDPSVASKLRDVLKFYEQKGKYLLHSWVIMPEHVHLLVERLTDQSIGALVRDIKKYFSYVYKSDFLGRVGVEDRDLIRQGNFHLWQTGFDEVTIGSQKQYLIKLNYILNNPVKRGLVNHPEDYPYCSATEMNGSGRV